MCFILLISILSFCFFVFHVFSFFEMGSHSVAQPGVQWHLHLPGSSHFSASASPVAGTSSMHRHAWLLFFSFLKHEGSCYVAHANLKLLASGDPPASASQSAEIVDVSRCAQRASLFKCSFLEEAIVGNLKS